jgi:hypothetical protein
MSRPDSPEAQGMETADVREAAEMVNPDRDQTAPGDSRGVTVPHDQAMEGTSEEYSSIENANPAPPTGNSDG